jgi:hypothetical protein
MREWTGRTFCAVRFAKLNMMLSSDSLETRHRQFEFTSLGHRVLLCLQFSDKWIEIRACAAAFAQLVAAENAPNRGFSQFAANQIRGHDEWAGPPGIRRSRLSKLTSLVIFGTGQGD